MDGAGPYTKRGPGGKMLEEYELGAVTAQNKEKGAAAQECKVDVM